MWWGSRTSSSTLEPRLWAQVRSHAIGAPTVSEPARTRATPAAPHPCSTVGAGWLAGGRRYGTLCVIDFVPRTFTAELYHMLVNFAELTCQELEKDWVRERGPLAAMVPPPPPVPAPADVSVWCRT